MRNPELLPAAQKPVKFQFVNTTSVSLAAQHSAFLHLQFVSNSLDMAKKYCTDLGMVATCIHWDHSFAPQTCLSSSVFQSALMFSTLSTINPSLWILLLPEFFFPISSFEYVSSCFESLLHVSCSTKLVVSKWKRCGTRVGAGKLCMWRLAEHLKSN